MLRRRSGRRTRAPRGVRGGGPGAACDGWKVDRDGTRVDVPMTGTLQIAPGERVVSHTCGGGGYGDPHEREPELVLRDAKEGWVSIERAESVYGVVIVREGDDLSVDLAADRESQISHKRSGMTVHGIAMCRFLRCCSVTLVERPAPTTFGF